MPNPYVCSVVCVCGVCVVCGMCVVCVVCVVCVGLTSLLRSEEHTSELQSR